MKFDGKVKDVFLAYALVAYVALALPPVVQNVNQLDVRLALPTESLASECNSHSLTSQSVGITGDEAIA